MSDKNAPPLSNPDAQSFFIHKYERAQIYKLLKKIEPAVFKPGVAHYPVPLAFTAHEFSTLLSYLATTADKKWRERTVAAWAMGVSALPEDKREQTITSLRKILYNRPTKTPALYRERFLTAFIRTLCACLLTSPWLIGLVFLAGASTFTVFGTIVGGMVGVALALTPFTLPLSLAYSADNNNQARASAAQALLRRNALEAMPELLEGSVEKVGMTRYWSRIAVFHLLPQITEENRNVMPLNSEDLVTRLLSSTTETVKYDWALGDVILDYLERFGHGSNVAAVQFYLDRLQFVRRLSDDSPQLIKGKHIVAVLKERQGQLNARQELLRHSSLPTTQPDQLLRPAADSQTTPAEQLLRASNAEQ